MKWSTVTCELAGLRHIQESGGGAGEQSVTQVKGDQHESFLHGRRIIRCVDV